MENVKPKSGIGEILKWIAIIAVIGFIIFAITRECNSVKPVVVKPLSDSVSFYKNKYGNQVAYQKGQEQQFAYIEKRYKDSLAKLHRNILEAVSIRMRGRAVVQGSGKPTIVYDTTYAMSFPMSLDSCPPQIKSLDDIFLSDYYTVQAHIETNGEGSFVEVQTYDTLSFIVKEVKEGGLFNRKTFIQVEASNANPHNIIENMKVYRVATKKQKRFGLGLQAGYGFSEGVQPRAYIGIGIHYSLINF